MNLREISILINELKEEKNPSLYDLEVLKFYKRKKEELIIKINNKIKSFEI